MKKKNKIKNFYIPFGYLVKEVTLVSKPPKHA